jgi:lipopolysaccharide export system protein LptA
VTGPVLAVLAALAAAPAPEPARPAAAPAEVLRGRSPVRVDAEEVQYAFQRREVTFSGKRPVVLTRDDATLSCRKIVALTDETGQIVTATCTGEVRFTRGQRTVTCEHATFENASDRVVCEGRPVLRDGATEAHGSRLVYDLRADEAKLEEAVITLPGETIDERQRELEARRKERKR